MPPQGTYEGVVAEVLQRDIVDRIAGGQITIHIAGVRVRADRTSIGYHDFTWHSSSLLRHELPSEVAAKDTPESIRPIQVLSLDIRRPFNALAHVLHSTIHFHHLPGMWHKGTCVAALLGSSVSVPSWGAFVIVWHFCCPIHRDENSPERSSLLVNNIRVGL